MMAKGEREERRAGRGVVDEIVYVQCATFLLAL